MINVMKKRGFSIRYKLLILLVMLPVTALLFYLVLATNLFKSDKLAYIFDSSTAVSRTLATQVRSLSESLLNSQKPVYDGYIGVKRKFDPTSQRIFTNDANMSYIGIFKPDARDRYRLDTELKKTFTDEEYQKLITASLKAVDATRIHGRSLQVYDIENSIVLVAMRYGSTDDPRHLVVVSAHKAETIIKSFRKAAIYASFLIENSGELDLGPENVNGIKDFASWEFFNKIRQRSLPEGTTETKSPEGQNLLMSYAQVGVGGLTVISYISKDQAFRAVQILLIKSILFFMAIVSIAVIISVFASRQLTSALRELFFATQKVSEGQYDVQLKVRSSDEVGALAENFNIMAGEISRLMKETASKARMEKELETAKTVQETLFPPSQSLDHALKISGYYQPAGECGGDWWHYGRIGTKTYLWIGDATGHGAPAALITSAAKSAASIIEILAAVTPAVAMQLMNRAIYSTSKGKMLMTFFLASFDETTGDLTYCNASHDPPFLLKHSAGPYKKSDILTLNDVNNPRLGQKPDTAFKQTTIKLSPGDMVFFYTDGVLDLHDPKAEVWGERRWIKCVLECATQTKKTEDTMSAVIKQINDYRQGAELIDDVTCFLAKFERAS